MTMLRPALVLASATPPRRARSAPHGLLAATAAATALVLAGCSADGSAEVEDYTLSHDGGNREWSVVEVQQALSEEQYEAILEDVQAGHFDEDGAYYVRIVCPGGELGLAHGTLALGDIGVQETGTGEGEWVVEIQDGVRCPG